MGAPDNRLDKLVTVAHLVAIVGLLGLLVYAVVKAALWPYLMVAIALPVLTWLARRRMWSLLRKRDVRCVACGAALWVPHRAFSKPSIFCPACGAVAFQRASRNPRPLPWFARDMTGTMRLWTALGTGGGLAAGLWIRFVKDLPLGSLEWTFLVLGGMIWGLVTGALCWHVFVKARVEALKRPGITETPPG